MKIIVTGAEGFLGWHTHARLHALTEHEVIGIGRSDWEHLPEVVTDADAVIHIAGINRASDDEVNDGNIQLAKDVASAVSTSDRKTILVYANSTQSTGDTPYGVGKRAAAEVLAESAADSGAEFIDVVLPNLFGEHGRPGYNSFVATFANMVVTGNEPVVHDREVELLHAQAAAQVLIDALDASSGQVRPLGTITSVATVLDTLQKQFAVYQRGDIPALTNQLEIDLFNTLRAAMFPDHFPIALIRRADNRGSLVETVRAHGSEGQTFFSTTKPGITRGQHYHLRKVERFVVIGGEARITLRRVLSQESVSFDVSGSSPFIVDMPTLWVHNITNTGDGDLTTMFWTNELFNPDDTDTYPEEV